MTLQCSPRLSQLNGVDINLKGSMVLLHIQCSWFERKSVVLVWGKQRVRVRCLEFGTRCFDAKGEKATKCQRGKMGNDEENKSTGVVY